MVFVSDGMLEVLRLLGCVYSSDSEVVGDYISDSPRIIVS